ncbi:MAG TPA: 23S rRNA (uracil(1939)-C(5))-methyltransferase RlmD [Methylococcus sp.]|nr:23S rRNA (uracil(1939)-C(5))-methyltransferase RlmD [Methylococcus sp.]
MGRRTRKKPVPKEPVQARVTGFAHDGRGIAHCEGRVVFIEGALPGEEVSFVYTELKRDYGVGRVECVLAPSPQRVAPRCPHFGVCGGCGLQHLAPEAQVVRKQELLLEQFRRIGRVEPEGLFSPLCGLDWGYRSKARLGVRYVAKKGRVLVGFRERASSYVAEIDSCPVLHPRIGERLREIAELIEGLSIRERLPQIEVAVGENSAALVFRVLEEPSAEDRRRLCRFGEEQEFDIYLQPRGPESITPLFPDRPRELIYSLPEHGVEFCFAPTEFTQVNAAINRKMVNLVLAVLDPEPEDRLLDLFCGIGNFTLPMARRAGWVVGVEASSGAIERARQNALRNGIHNVEFHGADLTRPAACGAWAEAKYDRVLLDPSRAGAQEILERLPQWQAQRIVYVSCNPATLARDAGILVHRQGYRMVRAGVMDMFPHTAHVESLAWFER